MYSQVISRRVEFVYVKLYKNNLFIVNIDKPINGTFGIYLSVNTKVTLILFVHLDKIVAVADDYYVGEG